MEDKLLAMLDAQRALQIESFGCDPLDMTNEERVEFIRWNVLALEDELHEMLGEVGWKPWATSRHVNVGPAFGEMVDAWHFFMNILLAVAGAGDAQTTDAIGQDFAWAYEVKREINARRQREGYDGIQGKCPDCKRDIGTTSITATLATGEEVTSCPCGKVLATAQSSAG